MLAEPKAAPQQSDRDEAQHAGERYSRLQPSAAAQPVLVNPPLLPGPPPLMAAVAENPHRASQEQQRQRERTSRCSKTRADTGRRERAVEVRQRWEERRTVETAEGVDDEDTRVSPSPSLLPVRRVPGMHRRQRSDAVGRQLAVIRGPVGAARRRSEWRTATGRQLCARRRREKRPEVRPTPIVKESTAMNALCGLLSWVASLGSRAITGEWDGHRAVAASSVFVLCLHSSDTAASTVRSGCSGWPWFTAEGGKAVSADWLLCCTKCMQAWLGAGLGFDLLTVNGCELSPAGCLREDLRSRPSSHLLSAEAMAFIPRRTTEISVHTVILSSFCSSRDNTRRILMRR